MKLFKLGLTHGAWLWLLGCSAPNGGGDTGFGEGGSGRETSGDAQGEGDDAGTGPFDGDEQGEDDDADGDDDASKFDLGAPPDAEAPPECLAPEHTPCDADSSDPFQVIGVNCPGEPQFEATYTGHPSAIYVHAGQLGTYEPATYPVREGEKMVVLSTGDASQIVLTGFSPGTVWPGNDLGFSLPAPLSPEAVDPTGTVDCGDDPSLVGTGECSNTVQGQWEQGLNGTGVNDYAELRVSGQVPEGASGFAYNLVFFSAEYPIYYQTVFNDMYIAWLESEAWTGNVSFDESGNPISLNAGFLDYKDAPNEFDCPPPCTAPELEGTILEGHAATKWLTTSVGVTAGEEFTLVFAIFDFADGILDSMVMLDNFEWNCDAGSPVTAPG